MKNVFFFIVGISVVVVALSLTAGGVPGGQIVPKIVDPSIINFCGCPHIYGYVVNDPCIYDGSDATGCSGTCEYRWIDDQYGPVQERRECGIVRSSEPFRFWDIR